MKTKFTLSLLIVTCMALLGACSKVATPVPGSYRAVVQTQGGEVPFELQVSSGQGQPMLSLVYADEAKPASNVKVHDGALQAELPQAAGTLTATLSRKGMQGELTLMDQGKAQTLPFTAELHKDYRFIEKASTDNADVSGYWQLAASDAQHFGGMVTLQLTQRFDAVDGQLLANGHSLPLLGQVHGDDVYLASLAEGRALLLKGQVNAQGELVGELWTNSSAARPWSAKRLSAEQGAALSGDDEQVHPVVRHWAVPQS